MVSFQSLGIGKPVLLGSLMSWIPASCLRILTTYLLPFIYTISSSSAVENIVINFSENTAFFKSNVGCFIYLLFLEWLKSVLVIRLSLTLCDPWECSPPGFCPWNSPGKKIGVVSQSLLQGIKPWFPALKADSLLSEPPGKPQSG